VVVVELIAVHQVMEVLGLEVGDNLVQELVVQPHQVKEIMAVMEEVG
jgi:hypothetical protein